MGQQKDFGKRKINRPITLPCDFEQQAKGVHHLSIRKICAGGEIDSPAKSILDRFTDDHFVRLNSLTYESIFGVREVLCLNNAFEKSQLQDGHL